MGAGREGSRDGCVRRLPLRWVLNLSVCLLEKAVLPIYEGKPRTFGVGDLWLGVLLTTARLASNDG